MSIATIDAVSYAAIFRDTRDRYVTKYGMSPAEAYQRAAELMENAFRCDVVEVQAEVENMAQQYHDEGFTG